MKISYKEIKKKQIENKKIYYNLYRNFSTPFTYMFVKMGFSPSAVSILNFFPCIIGFFLLSRGIYALMIIGLLFFVLYKIWDCSDGEVARIQNENSMNPLHKKIEGAYFDAVGHFIEPICLGFGLGVGLFHLYNNNIYFALGVFLSIIFMLDFALIELVRSYFRKGIIERKIKLKNEFKDIYNDLINKMNEGYSWQKQNLFLRIFNISPSGIIYSREFIELILIVLVVIELLLNNFGFSVNIISIYLFTAMLVKTINIANFILNLKNKEHITNFLIKLQNVQQE